METSAESYSHQKEQQQTPNAKHDLEAIAGVAISLFQRARGYEDSITQLVKKHANYGWYDHLVKNVNISIILSISISSK